MGKCQSAESGKIWQGTPYNSRGCKYNIHACIFGYASYVGIHLHHRAYEDWLHCRRQKKGQNGQSGAILQRLLPLYRQESCKENDKTLQGANLQPRCSSGILQEHRLPLCRQLRRICGLSLCAEQTHLTGEFQRGYGG